MSAQHEDMHGGDAGSTLRQQSTKIVEDVRELGQMALDSASEKAHELRDRGTAALEAGRSRTRAARHDLEQFVRDHPLRSLAIAAGIGALLGYRWRGRA